MAVERYYDYDIDEMKPSWDHLIEVVREPQMIPNGVVETDQNVSGTVISEVVVSQNIPTDTDLAKCLWCGKPFHGRSNKRFCTPGTERKLNFKRRQALTTAVAEHFKQRGCSVRTGSLRDVAKKCIDADYEALMKAMQKMGWKYNTKSCQWLKASH